jgi:hypothetical protein
MRGWRDGKPIWMCDACFTTAPPESDGWYEDVNNAIPGAPGLSPANRPKDPPTEVVTADQPRHYCPSHAPGTVAAESTPQDLGVAPERPL